MEIQPSKQLVQEPFSIPSCLQIDVDQIRLFHLAKMTDPSFKEANVYQELRKRTKVLEVNSELHP